MRRSGRPLAALCALALLAGACTDDAESSPTAVEAEPGSSEGPLETGDGADGATEATTGSPAGDTVAGTTAGGSTVDDPTGDTDTTVSPGVQPAGFTTVTVQITDADGEVCEKCLWLADESVERSTGLMEVTDLGEPSGMLFAFEREVEGSFFMLNTPTPLSIAWFAAGGAFVSSTDMDPCPAGTDPCPLFSAAGPYRFAIEVFQGDLPDLGIGPGSSIEVVADSESDTCVLAS